MASWSYEDQGMPSDGLRITSVAVTPDPPKPGGAVTLRIEAAVAREIKDGAYFNLTLKLGMIQVLQRRYDLFEELRGGGDESLKLSCNTSDGKRPIPPGKTVLTAVIDLPKDKTPRAKFKLNVSALTVDDEDVANFNLQADFSTV
ncbi:ML domain-containing protein [Kitasatospora sp. NPDC091335]|uniref:ML domain-containing protein n=1 Tax=Kitasatospora sp. NPDC091335 TaxID=3364085 RepID=UPI00380CD527